MVKKTQWLKTWMAADCGSIQYYKWFHTGLGLVYLAAFIPLFFQIDVLIGAKGLLPAVDLLHISYQQQGIFKSIIQFPSFFHLWPTNSMLYLLVALGCMGGLMLLLNRNIFWGALLAWASFISITSVGSDFFIIIIDLFLAEVGFLAILSSYFVHRYAAIPNLIDLCFKLLNFRLWFCMGVNKFYMPLDVWTNFTFFDYFFQAQPMPTPLAHYFHNAPQWAKYTAEAGLFVGEIIVPFFVFGRKKMRLIAFATFLVISVLIQLTGNYGFFNVLSVVTAFTILKKGDFLSSYKAPKNPLPSFYLPVPVSAILLVHAAYQLLYCFYVFDPTPYSYQNHYNYYFNNLKPSNKTLDKIAEPFRWIGYWRICNPYGVFKGIPRYHGELRFSGSNNGTDWQYYKFRFLPSALTDYTGFYAPIYPRLDHVMFYETLHEGAYLHNPLNNYSDRMPPWICNFLYKLSVNDTGISSQLKENPFMGKKAPQYIKVDAYKLEFAPLSSTHTWQEKEPTKTKIYTQDSINSCNTTILTRSEALQLIF
ncbi:MAG TPA: lipase maturation factor family protein [Chitinophagales bacterium]|nr:lipase maturation factor family protein [Chitinophagales bacterium]